MKKQMNVVVNGNPYSVEINDIQASPMMVLVNGKEYVVELGDDGSVASAAAVVQSPAVRPAQAAPAAAAPVRTPAAAPAAPVAAGVDAITAPMPGVILDIVVKPGQSVTQGQQILALEAMKMKNAIRSPKTGVIASVDVTEGQRVAYGAVLVRFA